MVKKNKLALYKEFLEAKRAKDSAQAKSSDEDFMGLAAIFSGDNSLFSNIGKSLQMSNVDANVEKIKAQVDDRSINVDDDKTAHDKKSSALLTIGERVKLERDFAREEEEFFKDDTATIKVNLGKIQVLLKDEAVLQQTKKYSQVIGEGFKVAQKNYDIVDHGIARVTKNPTVANFEVLLTQLYHASNYLTAYLNLREGFKTYLNSGGIGPREKSNIFDTDLFSQIELLSRKSIMSDNKPLLEDMDLSQKSVKILSKAYRSK